MIPANYLTGVQTIAAVACGDHDLAQVIRDHEIRYLDSTLKAWVVVDHKKAIGADVSSDKSGRLTGMVIGVKDIMGALMQQRSYLHNTALGYMLVTMPAWMLLLCRRAIKAAGAAVVGKTVTNELALGGDTPTLNPYDPSKTAGASSVGSAVAVCNYECHVALGTQSSGSLIRPAAFSGIFAFKPTFGRIAMRGVQPLAPTIYDTVGFMSRSIQDIQAVCRELGVVEPQSMDTVPAVGDLKIGFIKTKLFEDKATSEMRRVQHLANRSLAVKGVTVVEVPLDTRLERLAGPQGGLIKLANSEIGASLLNEYRMGPQWMSNSSRGTIKSGLDTDRSAMLAVEDELAALRPVADSIAASYDALLAPSAAGEAGDRGAKSDHEYNIMWTGLHVPVINMPGLFSKDGLPIGLSLIGPRCGDQKLLQTARAIAPILIEAGKPDAGYIPAPDGVVHLQP